MSRIEKGYFGYEIHREKSMPSIKVLANGTVVSSDGRSLDPLGVKRGEVVKGTRKQKNPNQGRGR